MRTGDVSLTKRRPVRYTHQHTDMLLCSSERKPPKSLQQPYNIEHTHASLTALCLGIPG